MDCYFSGGLPWCWLVTDIVVWICGVLVQWCGLWLLLYSGALLLFVFVWWLGLMLVRWCWCWRLVLVFVDFGGFFGLRFRLFGGLLLVFLVMVVVCVVFRGF